MRHAYEYSTIVKHEKLKKQERRDLNYFKHSKFIIQVCISYTPNLYDRRTGGEEFLLP